jgi:hypothetical protein
MVTAPVSTNLRVELQFFRSSNAAIYLAQLGILTSTERFADAVHLSGPSYVSLRPTEMRLPSTRVSLVVLVVLVLAQ